MICPSAGEECCFEGGSSYLKLLLTEHCGELGSQVGELQHYYVSPGSYLWTQGLHNLGSQVGELQHYYISPGSYLWTQGLHNCVDYAFLFVGIVEGGGEVMATCFDLWGWG